MLLVNLSACSPEPEQSQAVSSEPGHVWKEQVNALHKAEQLEQDMGKAFQQRDAELERQMQ